MESVNDLPPRTSDVHGESKKLGNRNMKWITDKIDRILYSIVSSMMSTENMGVAFLFTVPHTKFKLYTSMRSATYKLGPIRTIYTNSAILYDKDG